MNDEQYRTKTVGGIAPQLAVPRLEDVDPARSVGDVAQAVRRWSTQLAASLTALARHRTVAGTTAERPAAAGTGLVYLDAERAKMAIDKPTSEVQGTGEWTDLAYLDTPETEPALGNLAEWRTPTEVEDAGVTASELQAQAVAEAVAEATTLDVSHFDNLLGPSITTIQKAMDLLDDHSHPATKITVDTSAFGHILGAADDTVQEALDVLDDIDATAIRTSTANFGEILGALDAEVQHALDTLDDHSHDTLRILNQECETAVGLKTGLSSGVAASLWKVTIPEYSADGGCFDICVQVKSGTVVQVYWASLSWGGVYEGSPSTNTAAGPTVIANQQILPSGTLSVSCTIDGSVAGDFVHKITVTTSLGTPDIRVKWITRHAAGTYLAL